jgi:hypothetical protein
VGFFYNRYPEVLIPVKNSTAILGKALAQYSFASDFASFVKTVVIPDWLGVFDPTEEELAFLTKPGRLAGEYDGFVAKMTSDRAQLGWATHGVCFIFLAHLPMCECECCF